MMFLHAESSHAGFGDYESHYYYRGRKLTKDEETRVDDWKHKQRKKRLAELKAEAKWIAEVRESLDADAKKQETFGQFARQVQSFKALGKVLKHTPDEVIASKLGDVVESLHNHLVSTEQSAEKK